MKLNEEINDISADIEWMTQEYIKPLMDSILLWPKTNIINSSVADMTKLKSELLRKAYELNPIEIQFTTSAMSPFYSTQNKIIVVNPSPSAMGLFAESGSIETCVSFMPDRIAKAFRREFEPERVELSLVHELAHWLDDTLHNNHVFNSASTYDKHAQIGKELEYIKKRNAHWGGEYNYSEVEREAQIQSIAHYKGKIGDKLYNKMSFDDMLNNNGGIGFFTNESDKKDKHSHKWKKELLKRMSREGLLGDNMRFYESFAEWIHNK